MPIVITPAIHIIGMSVTFTTSSLVKIRFAYNGKRTAITIDKVVALRYCMVFVRVGLIIFCKCYLSIERF